MTNNELLTADLLDILFDGRNKEYGAYALRRGYDRRLMMALGMGLSLIIFFILLNSFSREKKNVVGKVKVSDGIRITQVVLPPAGPVKPPPAIKPPAVSRPIVEQVAMQKNTTIKIVPNNEILNTEVPENTDLTDKLSGTETADGHAPTGANGTDHANIGDGTVASQKPAETVPVLPSSNPEYPGGLDALRTFIFRNLDTEPDQLEPGDKKIVRVRFVVDIDGSISQVNVETSAGALFDRAVMRVCKKMPKWKPGIQNGRPVSMSFVLPVTFIGIEP